MEQSHSLSRPRTTPAGRARAPVRATAPARDLERIERAREMGDIKENADYDAAKNEQGLNEARVRQLEQMLRDVVDRRGVRRATSSARGRSSTILFDGDDEPTGVPRSARSRSAARPSRCSRPRRRSARSSLGQAPGDAGELRHARGHARSRSRSSASAPPTERRSSRATTRRDRRRASAVLERPCQVGVPQPPPPGVRMRRTSPARSWTVTLSPRRSARRLVAAGEQPVLARRARRAAGEPPRRAHRAAR